MISRILLLIAGLLAVQSAAVIVDVNLSLKELRLKDGLLFTDVAVRSFNTTSGTVMLLANKDLVSVRTSLLPDELSARLKAMAPAQTPEEVAAEQRQLATDRAKAAENAERRQRLAEEEAKAARAASRTQNVRATEQAATQPDRVLAEVAAFADQRAHAHFKYQDDPHSNIGAVIGSDIFLDRPEPVPGWAGRYRVEGKAYRQYVNNQASGFGRTAKEFEILVQTHEHKNPEIIEIRIK